ncbi:hypothetical protein CMUS01_01924 [Colletotrichum musicola]|uniref:Uncharacterized protein n=1 Tax=Colletotrichum musicola TaxID=2175873 RepID=A0A8H6NVW9_9PEZI|nr:hypothetical protein CMUS01_01924 [Colletotrichum musicola]
MPAVIHPELALDEPSSTAHPYHHLSASHICTGLTILVLLVLLRLIAHGVFRSGPGSEGSNNTSNHEQARRDLNRLVSQQQLHHLFFSDRAWTMEEKSRGVSSNTKAAAEDRPSRKSSPDPGFVSQNEKETPEGKENESVEQMPLKGNMFGPGNLSDLSSTRLLLSRPPPPPPLTPPELSPSVFTYDDRRRSFGATELDASFFEQPNPDYMSSTEEATTTATSSTQTTQTRSSPTPRRRSYTRTLPMPVPLPPSPAGHLSNDGGYVFSPSSYPPTSPTLPGPPPSGPPPIHGEIMEDGTFRKIDVQGEIITLMDDNGAGWRRHTRVYGGGACLACAACDHNDDHQGGFYGENVLPEEKRY